MSVIKTIYTTSSGIDTRRFQLSNTSQISPYHQIQHLLTSTYGQQIYGLKYTDDDGDVCSIGSDLELNEAFRVYTGKVLKLEVTILPSSSTSTNPSTSTDLTDDVISLDGSIESDFDDDDRAPSPIPSDVFDPSVMQSQAIDVSQPTSPCESVIHSHDPTSPAERVHFEQDVSDVNSSVSTHQTPSNIIPVDALDVLPPVEAEASIVEIPAVEPVVKPTEPLPSPSPLDVDVITLVPQLPSPIIDVITDMVKQVEIAPVEDVKAEPVIEPVVESIIPVTESVTVAIPEPATVSPVSPVTVSPVSFTGIDGMTQSMTETKYDTPDEKHGTKEWACYACTFVNDGLASSCTMCGSPKMIITWTNNGISTIIPPRPTEEKSSIMAGVMNFAREARDAVKDVIKAITPERSAPQTTPAPAPESAPAVPVPAPAPMPAPVVSAPAVSAPVSAPVSVPAVPEPMPSVPIAVAVSTPAVSATPGMTRVTSAPASAPAPPTFIHHGIRCDGCGVSPLAGTRYKCTVCADYDLCDKCESRNIHHPDHTMIKMRAPVPTPIPVRTIHRPISMPYHGYPHVPTHLGLPPHLGGGCDLGSTGYPPHAYPMPMPHPMPMPVPMPMPMPRIPSRTPRGRPRAEFIPSTSTDGFIVELGSVETVHKIWSLRNSGTYAWPHGAAFVHISGKLVPHMNDGAESVVTLLPECAPGAIVHIACDIAVPRTVGKFRGHYRLMTVDRERFGPKIWVCIEVVEKKEEKKEVPVSVTEPAPTSPAPSSASVVTSTPAPVVVTTPAIVTPPTEEPTFVSISTPTPLEHKSSDIPPFEYSHQLQQLHEMGFTDVELCKYLLLNNKGDFQKVCEWLIQEAK